MRGLLMTKYEVITGDIRKKIQNGTYAVSTKLPTEPEMCETYKVSRITVKKAIDQLVMDGLVIKKRGSGTFVKGLEDHKGQISTQLNGLYINKDKSTIQSDIVLFEVINAGKFIADKLNIEEDAGYYVEDPASGLNGWYVWIIDYSKYAFNVESITVKGNCDGFWLEGSPTVPVMYYYTPTGNRITVKREFNVAYQTLEWSEDNNYFSPKNVQRSLTEGPYSTKINDNETIPLCDTEVTLSGDQFAKHFGIEKSITSDTYQAVAVEVHVDTTFIMDNAENMTAGDGEYISAPATVTFRAYANDPVATLYTWKIYRSDQENGIENPLVEYRDEEIDYTFTEKGDYTAVATVSNATGECEAVSNSIEIKIAESELQIPNAFSPGTTPGINDEFRVAYKSLVTYKCWIFNRWGVQMFHSTNPAEGWDGKKGGKYVAPGVYFYVIDAVGSDGIKYNKKGSINILRPKKIDDEIIEQ